MHAILSLVAAFAIQDAELVKGFLEGSKEESARAAEALRKRGAEAIPALVRARAKYKDRAELFALLTELKKASQNEDGRKWMEKLGAAKADADFEKVTVKDVLDFYSDFFGLTFCADPAAAENLKTAITLKAKSRGARELLDETALLVGLDWDVRYGVFWLAPPERLWPMGKTPPLARANAWTAQKDADPKTVAALRETQITLEQDGAALSDVVQYLRECTGKNILLNAKSVEIHIRVQQVAVADLLALLTLPYGLDVRLQGETIIIYDPNRKAAAGLTFRSQKLEGEDEKVAAKLKETKLSLDFDNATIEDVCQFIEDSAGFKFRLDGVGARKITIKVKDLSVWNTLSLLLPMHDLDAKIEKGTIVIFDPERK